MTLNSQEQYGIVVSQFNPIITDTLLKGAVSRLKELNVLEVHIKIIHVPGAIEIPFAAKRLAMSQHYDAILCLGAVIRGETNHYDYVCEQVSQGCQHVMLHYDIPVIFGVLTTENVEQAKERIGGKKGHKGIDAANTAVYMAKLAKQLF